MKIVVFDGTKEILKRSFLDIPNADGAAGSVLGTDGNGNLSWIAPASSIKSTFYDVTTFSQSVFTYTESLDAKNFSVYVNGVLQRRDEEPVAPVVDPSFLESWTNFTHSLSVSVIWINERRYFISSSYGKMWRSYDGEIWSPISNSAQGTYAYLAYSPELGSGKGRIVSLSRSISAPSNYSRYSDNDGQSWTTMITKNTTDVIWCSGISKFVSVSDDNDHQIQYSSDGINWTSVSIGSGSTFAMHAIHYDEKDNLLVAAGADGAYKSSNASTWVKFDSSAYLDNSVTSNGKGTWILSPNATNNQLKVYTNSLTSLETVTIPANSTSHRWRIWFNRDANIFVGSENESGDIAYSTNATTWVNNGDGDIPANSYFYDLAWSNFHKKYVAVGVNIGAVNSGIASITSGEHDFYTETNKVYFRYSIPFGGIVRIDLHTIGTSVENTYDFTATEGQTIFSTDRLLAGKMVQVYRNGVYQRINDGNDYVIIESSVVFNYGVPGNSWVHIVVRE